MAQSSFTLDISRFIEKTKLNAETVVRRISIQAFTRVVKRTPVDTGRARANWQLNLNSLPTGQTSGGGATLSQLSNYSLGDVVFIANNVPYIAVLEYGGYPKSPKGGSGKTSGGFSTQAPYGMVGVTMNELQSVLKEEMEALS
jgi:hypothetical protein